MILLHIETSTTVCSAAISENNQCLLQKINTEGQNHAKLLSLFIDELLAYLKANNKKLDGVALSKGPGSYTGLRIGTATAKGICYGLDIPLIAVDTLQIMALSAKQHLTTDETVLLCPMIDARRMEVYDALYTPDLQTARAVEAHIIDETAFQAELANTPIYFFGNGADKCRQTITHPNARFIENIYPEAAMMITLAETRYQQQQFEDVAYFDPFYLKEFQTTVSKKKMF